MNKTQLYQTNLCKEITIIAQQMQCVLDTMSFDTGFYYAPYVPYMIKPKYKFSRAKWYEAEYNWMHYNEVIEWCIEKFGANPKYPDAWSRWNNRYKGKIQFRDQKDYVLFMLRWA